MDIVDDQQEYLARMALTDGNVPYAQFLAAQYGGDAKFKNGESVISYAIKSADQKIGAQFLACTKYNAEDSDKCKFLSQISSSFSGLRLDYYNDRKFFKNRKNYDYKASALKFSFEPLLKKMKTKPEAYPKSFISEETYNTLTGWKNNISDLGTRKDNGFAVVDTLRNASTPPLSPPELAQLETSKSYAQPAIDQTEQDFADIEDPMNILSQKMTAGEFMAARKNKKIQEAFPHLADYKPTPREFLETFGEDDDADNDGPVLTRTRSRDDDGPEKENREYQNRQNQEQEEYQKQQQNQLDQNEFTRQEMERLAHAKYFEWQPERQADLIDSMATLFKDVQREMFINEMKQQQQRNHERRHEGPSRGR